MLQRVAPCELYNQFGLDLEHFTNPPRGVVKEGSGARREPVSRTRGGLRVKEVLLEPKCS